jgi:hypothetical protein
VFFLAGHAGLSRMVMNQSHCCSCVRSRKNPTLVSLLPEWSFVLAAQQ